MYKSIVCRYHEIATKGHNRPMFENRLVLNIRTLCGYEGIDSIFVQRTRGRVFVRKKDGSEFSEEELQKVEGVLSRTYGLESFSPVIECAPKLETVLETAVNSARPEIERLLETRTVLDFRTRARRSDKSFPLNSKELEIAVADRLYTIFGERLKVNLDDASYTIGIEVREKIALVYYETLRGPGGLPVGSNADVLAMLSGGIDSPVACTMTMRRGCHVDFLTFHSFPYTPMESLEKVKKITAVLNTYQKKGRLFACNLAEIQKLIRDNCEPRYRTVLYRRMMIRIATKICHFHKMRAIVTGESVGQVASQTIVNMGVINEATDMLMLRPLVGMDKMESIERAKKLGTYELSIIDLPDSCTVFAPPSPAVAAKYNIIEEEEKKIPDLDAVLERAFLNMERFDNL